ncbi:hypothetical protein PRUPE_8G132400 [Prunus persica]|uniref:DNA-directed RNA polymerase RpoA/D/Rpb3-type domain-containing protein n=1 Tax=Prunus persica TaxID=3760 RepID=M5VY08_PRUPE|nr:hypothetical protein PRUPE_8G132400 [Prunus persica]
MEGKSYQRLLRVKIREMRDDYMKFELRDADASVANALRRVMIAEVPTVAIDLVEIQINSLGLIPLTSDQAMSMRFSSDCDSCDGDGQCEFCSVEFHLRGKCHSDQTPDFTIKDLLSSDHTVVPVDFSDSAGMESSKQKDNHCEVAKGARADSSAATVTFMYEPDIQINEELMDMLTLDEKKAWVESSPTKVFDFDPKTEKVVVVDPEAYTYDDEVIKKAEAMGKPGLVDIIAKEDSFIFTVESTGAVKASQLLLNAIEVLNQKLDAVRLSEDTVEADDQFGELGAHMRGG